MITDTIRLDWIADRLQDMAIDHAEPARYVEGDNWPAAWRRAIDEAIVIEDKLTERELLAELGRLRAHLINIRDIALCSEGVEFYAMLADKALNGDPA